MKRVKLDRIDLKILRTMQADGRISNVDLAKQAGISAPPCLRRVRALEDAGYIKSYHAKLNAEKLGYHVMVYTQVSLTSHTETDLQKFIDAVNSWPQVRECVLLSGDVDFILKIVAESFDAYQTFLTTHLTKYPLVHHVKSSLVVRQTKDDPGVPVGDTVPARQQ